MVCGGTLRDCTQHARLAEMGGMPTRMLTRSCSLLRVKEKTQLRGSDAARSVRMKRSRRTLDPESSSSNFPTSSCAWELLGHSGSNASSSRANYGAVRSGPRGSVRWLLRGKALREESHRRIAIRLRARDIPVERGQVRASHRFP